MNNVPENDKFASSLCIIIALSLSSKPNQRKIKNQDCFSSQNVKFFNSAYPRLIDVQIIAYFNVNIQHISGFLHHKS